MWVIYFKHSEQVIVPGLVLTITLGVRKWDSRQDGSVTERPRLGLHHCVNSPVFCFIFNKGQLFFFFCLWLLWAFGAVWGLSLVVESRGFSLQCLLVAAPWF